MIKVIANMPVGTIGLRASGKVSEADYRDVLVPTINSAMEQGSARLMYVLEDEADYKPGRCMGRHEDVVQEPEGMGARRHRLRRRLARERSQGVRLVDAGRVKVFEPVDVRDAKQWLVGIDDD
jgi:SpoIIAA-like